MVLLKPAATGMQVGSLHPLEICKISKINMQIRIENGDNITKTTIQKTQIQLAESVNTEGQIFSSCTRPECGRISF
jgi:hypothetical protein